MATFTSRNPTAGKDYIVVAVILGVVGFCLFPLLPKICTLVLFVAAGCYLYGKLKHWFWNNSK